MINNWSEGLLHAVDVPLALLVWCVMSPELTNASPSPGTCIMVYSPLLYIQQKQSVLEPI